jgi:RNA polymerase sigma factor (TIGR02999 family)
METLMPLVVPELHRIAIRYLAKERPGHTLSPTALVNEAYLRLVDTQTATWHDRTHFYAVCALTMRHVLVDWARSRQARKRGGSLRLVDHDGALLASKGSDLDLVALDEALLALASFDQRKSRVIELRFFGGLSVKDTADVLAVSQETVLRDWRLAKAWLRRELKGEGTVGS